MNGKTKTYGIIGNPVSHSMSPIIHNAAFADLNINAAYLPFTVEDVGNAIAGVKALSIYGLSVTIPHKESVIPYLDDVDSVAKKIGAVNTVVRHEVDGDVILKGYNTDWIGANRALSEVADLEGNVVLLLGAGGSARAIAFGLKQAGAEVILANRSVDKVAKLASEVGCSFCELSEIDKHDFRIVVNATSVGMAPLENITLLSREQLEPVEVVMDIVYAPLETCLLKEAKKAGCKTVSGLEMLLYQAVAQFELWQDRPAPIEVMRSQLYSFVATKNDK
ncbi:MAG: shikimate dehydrogenase [Desulfotalea sp.]